MLPTLPFLIRGGAASTVAQAVTAVSAQVTITAPQNDRNQLILTNIGTQTVFLAYGNVTASITTSMPILANTQITISYPAGTTQLSIIAAAAGSTLYVTSGDGKYRHGSSNTSSYVAISYEYSLCADNCQY